MQFFVINKKRFFIHIFEIFWIFFKLGMTSFGGPTAHLGIFFEELVQKRKWVTTEQFQELIVIAQIMPGPASSQVGMMIGYQRCRSLGSLCAWLGFTLPSAIIMIVLGSGLYYLSPEQVTQYTQNFRMVALPLICVAIFSMAQQLVKPMKNHLQAHFLSPRRKVSDFLFLLLILLITSLSNALMPFLDHKLQLIISQYLKVGSLIIGGGHVALPLLQNYVETPSREIFLMGYGFSQALPGPLFSITAFTAQTTYQNVGLSLILMSAAFLPSFVFAALGLTYWNKLKQLKSFIYFIKGMSAVALLFLIQTVYDSFFKNIHTTPRDILVALFVAVWVYGLKKPIWMTLPIILIFNLTDSFF